MMGLINSTNSALDDFIETLVNDGMDDSTIIRFVKEQDAAISKWISVSDKLPINSGKYLVYPSAEFDASFYASHLKQFAVERLYKVKITHWMPCPSPPNS